MSLGMGVIIQALGGNKETIVAVQSSIGKEIAHVAIENNFLNITFTDQTALSIWDNGQSCCEERYMRTDDDLAYYVGSTLMEIEIRAAPNEPDQYGEHEVQFLAVKTSKGIFVLANHNEHNGYYGGFWIAARIVA